MITLHISARKCEVNDELESYMERKLGKLDKYFPRQHQPTGMVIELTRDESVGPDKRYHISVNIAAPQHPMHAETATMNPHSAVDIIEAKLKEQIRKYKEKHTPRRLSLKRMAPITTADEEA